MRKRKGLQVGDYMCMRTVSKLLLVLDDVIRALMKYYAKLTRIKNVGGLKSVCSFYRVYNNNILIRVR